MTGVRQVGGDQLDPWTYLHVIEEISRHDGSVGWNLFVTNSAALIAPFIPLETARAIFGDPRAWVSWGPPNQFKAHAVPGGYRVSGTKLWTTNGHLAHYMILLARTDPDAAERHAGLSQFLVDLAMPGVTIRPILIPTGKREFNEVVFEDMFLPVRAFGGLRHRAALRQLHVVHQVVAAALLLHQPKRNVRLRHRQVGACAFL